jgi:hypothetical protein
MVRHEPGVLSVISTDDLRVVVSEDLQQEEKCKFLYRARRLNIIENDQRSYCTVLSLILSGDIPIRSGRKPQSVIELFNQAVSPMPYASAFRFSQPIPLAEIWLNNKRNEMFADLSGDHIQEKPDFPETRKCLNVIESARLEILKSAQEWATEISPWDNLIEQIRTNWGDQWICYTLANIGSGIKSQTETCTDCPDFLDRKTSLARRTRYARLRAGTISWWVNQFDQVQDSQDIMSILLTLITWGSSNTIVQLSQLIDETVQELSYSEWQRVHRSVEETIQFTREQANDRLIKFDPKKLSNFGNQRTVALLGTRTKAETRKVIYSRYLSKYNGDDPIILRFCQNNALDLLESGEINWHDALDVIAQSYAKGIVSERYAFHRFIRRTKNQIIPRDMAQEIALNPHRYPGYLVAAAETVCKNMVASTIVPVGKIAERDKWFNH